MKKKNVALSLIGISLFASQFMHSDYNVVDNSLKNLTEGNTTTCKVTSGSINKIGSEVSCGTEQFYVIESNKDTVTLFSKYNLKGYKQDSTDLGYPSSNSTAFDFKGYRSTEKNSYCTSYSTGGCNAYGPVGGEFVNGELKGTVTEESAIKQQHVNGYSSTLNLGDNLKSIGLITKEQLISLGCTGSSPVYECTNSGYDWIYSTSYWTSSPAEGDTTNVYVVRGGDTNNGNKGSLNFFSAAWNDNEFGVRPVITISKDAIVSVEKEDTVNKVTLKAESTTIISKDIEFKTSVITEVNEIFSDVKTYLKNPGVAQIYDISLYQNNTKVQPNGNVTLTFEIENMDINKVKAYRINDDNTLTKLETKIVDGKLEVTTNHFSVYILTEEEIDGNVQINETVKNDIQEDQVENPDTGDEILYILPAMALIILSIVFVSSKLKNKKCHR